MTTMERKVVASTLDMNSLLFGEAEPREYGATKWKDGQMPEFIKYLRSEARSFDCLLCLLTDGINGKDARLSSIAAEDVAEGLDDGWDIHPAYLDAIRYCNIQEFNTGLDAGVVLAMGRHLRDFSVEYTNENGEERTDLYCLKEQGKPSSFAVLLGNDIWLQHDMTISIPKMPESWQITMTGKPLVKIIDHPCIGQDDMAEAIKTSGDYTEITGIKPRKVERLCLSMAKLQKREAA